MASKYPRRIEAGLTPANCWQVLAEKAQEQLRQWREAGEMSEREMVVCLLRGRDYVYPVSFSLKYEGMISDFVHNAHLAKDKMAEKEIRRYVGQFWYGGQPRE